MMESQFLAGRIESLPLLGAGGLSWGAPEWGWPAALLVSGLALLIGYSYLRRGLTAGTRWVAALLKLTALASVAVCIVEPLVHGARPRPGANLFLVAVDNSRSLDIADDPGGTTRGEMLRGRLVDDAPWLVRLGQDFEVRRYYFDTRLRSTDSFRALTFDGTASTLGNTLAALAKQYRDRPVAGILLLTDGNATDWRAGGADLEKLPPVYPVMVGRDEPVSDVAVSRVTVTQTNFETAPVTLLAEVAGESHVGEQAVIQLLDPEGQEVQRFTGRIPSNGPLTHRFQFPTSQPGVSFYRVRAYTAGDEERVKGGQPLREATSVNNSRLALVDRGRGPYRVLYVGGRPNWEFKFLRRAVHDDEEVELIGLVRIAKREPKFSFRSRDQETTNPLFRGFGNQGDETAEQYDEPVLIRFGTQDQQELRAGFPKTAEDLFGYHAVILDDVEAEFFTQDQMALLRRFVSQRGGSVLMLGGQESFASGNYARTPLGELLPVYLDKLKPGVPAGTYRWGLSREGWLQPWVRLRAVETDEESRLAAMPLFRTVNGVAGLKPGASVLVDLRTVGEGAEPTTFPALATQSFGQGRSAALLVGDFWRWGMRRPQVTTNDHAQAWRQIVRWLVAEVPGPVSLVLQSNVVDSVPQVGLRIQVRDPVAEPLDNASLKVTVSTPDGKSVPVQADPSVDTAGEYVANYTPRLPGGYVVKVAATNPDGSPIAETAAGFTHEPELDELRSLRPNRRLLENLATQTGGEVITTEQLDRFVTSLPNRRIPITEPWIHPLWHQWPLMVLAMACLIGEWGLRRWKGWP